jgi:hypothetical protein
MVDLMEDEDLKQSVIDQMMGELDGETSKSLKKGGTPSAGGITIVISPMGTVEGAEGKETPEEEAQEIECGIEGCTDPEHNHPEPSDETPVGEDYISRLVKALGANG